MATCRPCRKLLWFGALSLATFIAAPASAQQCVLPPVNLLTWWRGEADFTDEVNSLVGIPENGTSFAAGFVGDAFDFDGIDDDIIVPNVPELNFGTRSFSIQVWVLLRSAGPTGRASIISKRVESEYETGWIFLRNPWSPWTDRWRFFIGSGPGTIFNVVSDFRGSENTFVHLVVVVDRENALLKMYVNGLLQRMVTDISNLGSVDNIGPLRIGCAGLALEDAWDGIIDEIAIFDRALTQAEVFDLLLAGEAGMCPGLIVELDVQPGREPNIINSRSRGLLAVAILSTPEYDATLIDPQSVELAGAPVAEQGQKGKLHVLIEDVNADGLLDLILKFEVQALDFTQLETGWADLTGLTFEGRELHGYDEVTLR